MIIHAQGAGTYGSSILITTRPSSQILDALSSIGGKVEKDLGEGVQVRFDNDSRSTQITLVPVVAHGDGHCGALYLFNVVTNGETFPVMGPFTIFNTGNADEEIRILTTLAKLLE